VYRQSSFQTAFVPAQLCCKFTYRLLTPVSSCVRKLYNTVAMAKGRGEPFTISLINSSLGNL
jgi:hypothetical protein